jgi:hypothetical protein
MVCPLLACSSTRLAHSAALRRFVLDSIFCCFALLAQGLLIEKKQPPC